MKGRNPRTQDNVPRSWWWLPTLDLYVFREFTIKFAVIMLLASILFIAGDVFNDLEDFLSHSASLHEMGTYFMLKLPGHVRFVLPISVLLGCMWTMATFGKNHEVTAMRASGLSLFRCGGAILLAGAAVTAVNYWFNEAFVPYSERAAVALLKQVKDGEVPSDQRLLAFTSPDRRRSWLFDLFEGDREYQSVILKCKRPNGTLEQVLQAERVKYDPKEGWTFYDVLKRGYSSDGLLPKKPEYVAEMKVEGITEDPGEILNSIKETEELPIWAIWRILQKTEEMPESVRCNFLTVLCYRLTFPLSCFLAAFLGIPLATRNERSGILLAVIVAVVIIVAYIVASQTFMVLGRRGVINPYVAGAAPTIVFIIYGYWRVLWQRV